MSYIDATGLRTKHKYLRRHGRNKYKDTKYNNIVLMSVDTSSRPANVMQVKNTEHAQADRMLEKERTCTENRKGKTMCDSASFGRALAHEPFQCGPAGPTRRQRCDVRKIGSIPPGGGKQLMLAFCFPPWLEN